MLIESESSNEYTCRYGLLISDIEGRSAAILYSPSDRFCMQENQTRHIQLVLDQVLLGHGEYVVGISVLEYSELEFVNEAIRYDLLGRSFLLSVNVSETLQPTVGAFVHPGRWGFASLSNDDSK